MKLLPNASVLPYLDAMPKIGKDVLIASGARLIGNLTIGDQSSIWFNVVVRGDVQSITIGARTNIQDNSTLHVTSGTGPTKVGNDVTIGHNVLLHACTIEDLTLIGMGSIILDGAIVPKESMVGAGSLVTGGKTFPPRSLIIGSPARAVRSLSEAEIQSLQNSATHYIATAHNYFRLCQL